MTPWGVQGMGTARLAPQEAAEVGGVETVNILLRCDGLEDGALVDVVGQGELLEDGMEANVGVELADASEQGFPGDGRGQADSLGRRCRSRRRPRPWR